MLRKIFKSDLAELQVIENASHDTPWTNDVFKMCLQAGYLGWAIELDQHLIAFIVVSMQSQECHVLNLCVARAYRRQGWARQLLAHALDEAKRLGAGVAYLEVRRSNTRALALYEGMQFSRVGERKGYYQTVAGAEDALVLARHLDNPAISC